MSDEPRLAEMELDPRHVLMAWESASTRMSMPVAGDVRAECLVLLYAGVRSALGSSAVHERVAFAVPDENIVEHIESLINGAPASFADLTGGLRLDPAGSTRGVRAGRSVPWIRSHCGVASYGPMAW